VTRLPAPTAFWVLAVNSVSKAFGRANPCRDIRNSRTALSDLKGLFFIFSLAVQIFSLTAIERSLNWLHPSP